MRRGLPHGKWNAEYVDWTVGGDRHRCGRTDGKLHAGAFHRSSHTAILPQLNGTGVTALKCGRIALVGMWPTNHPIPIPPDLRHPLGDVGGQPSSASASPQTSGIPSEMWEANERLGQHVDWSAAGIPQQCDLNKRSCPKDLDLYWNCPDWTQCDGNVPFIFRQISGQSEGMFYENCPDWSNGSLPIRGGERFDPMVVNWGPHGLPMGGKPTPKGRNFCL